MLGMLTLTFFLYFFIGGESFSHNITSKKAFADCLLSLNLLQYSVLSTIMSTFGRGFRVTT